MPSIKGNLFDESSDDLSSLLQFLNQFLSKQFAAVTAAEGQFARGIRLAVSGNDIDCLSQAGLQSSRDVCLWTSPIPPMRQFSINVPASIPRASAQCLQTMIPAFYPQTLL